MDWEKVIRKHFAKQGFRAEWVWMTTEGPFLLLWKGRQVQVCYVDLSGLLALKNAQAIRESFLSLLKHLNRLPQRDGIFKGREVVFRWILLEEPPAGQRQVLQDAGVETFLFKPPLA